MINLRKLDLLNTDLKIEDIERNYYNSIFIINYKDEFLPFMLRSFYGSVIEGYIPNKNEWTAVSQDLCLNNSLYYLNPPIGFYNFLCGAFYLTRTSTRQYRCGFNTNTYTTEWAGNLNNMERILSVLNIDKYKEGYSLLKQPMTYKELLNPFYPSPEEAVQLIIKGMKLQVAVSPFFAYSLSNANSISLLYNNIFVGTHSIKTNKVILYTAIDADMMDVVENNGIRVAV